MRPQRATLDRPAPPGRRTPLLLSLVGRRLFALSRREVLAPGVPGVPDAEQLPARAEQVAMVAGRVAPAVVGALRAARLRDVLAATDGLHAGGLDAVARRALAGHGGEVR